MLADGGAGFAQEYRTKREGIALTDGHLPYPYGREITGYEVSDLGVTLKKARSLGVTVLVQHYTADERISAVVKVSRPAISQRCIADWRPDDDCLTRAFRSPRLHHCDKNHPLLSAFPAAEAGADQILGQAISAEPASPASLPYPPSHSQPARPPILQSSTPLRPHLVRALAFRGKGIRITFAATTRPRKPRENTARKGSKSVISFTGNVTQKLNTPPTHW